MANPQLQAALRELLEHLYEVSQEHGEIFDTDCREQMFDAVYSGFIKPKPGYVLPDAFGLYQPEGNQTVRTALEKYIQTVVPVADGLGLSPQERLDAFQDYGVTVGEDGLSPDEFFGWLETVD